MSDSETAMRDAQGRAVFVRETGEYTETFPQEHIVRRADSDETAFLVYGFVGTNADFDELKMGFEQEDAAIQFATDWYGQENPDGAEREGEVFEVEVHEVNRGDVEKHTVCTDG